ncbi:HupE/UreJ family protein [Pseudoalteromonas sp. GB56]
MRLYRWLFVLLVALCCFSSSAHEIRPAYLQIQQTSDTNYRVLWRVPAKGDMVLKLTPVFSEDFTLSESGPPKLVEGSMVYQYVLTGEEDLQGSSLRINNLEKTMVDTLITVEYLSGEKVTLMLKPDKPDVTLPHKVTSWQVASTYTFLGVEHILLGFDHLLFVLALLIISVGIKKLIQTITAFTLAHSITLSCSVLGWAKLPGPPVEAVIALSIVFLAVEILRVQNGTPTLTSRNPWLVAFIFGLLHGFGFAGALADIGLPQTETPLALATFNIGVELGQLIFIAIVLAIKWAFINSIPKNRFFERLVPYSIGTIAMFWTIERISGF